MLLNKHTREQCNKIYADVMKSENEVDLRRLCREDLFFLLTVGFKRRDVNHPWLYERVREVENRPDEMLDLWGRELYKFHSLNTRCFTPQGWRRFGDIQVGDEVFAPSGRPVKVLARTPIHEGPTHYSITFSTFQGDIKTEVDAGSKHLWEVTYLNRVKGGRWLNKVVNTQNIFEFTKRKKMQQSRNRRWYKVRMAAAFEFPEKRLPIDPYTLGVWLGDGHSASGTITNGDAEILHRTKGEIGASADIPRCNTRRFSIKGLYTTLKDIGFKGVKSKTKFIPEDYFTASISQRRDLLRGLCDTDAGLDFKGRADFTTTSKALMEGVSRLVLSLGGAPHVQEVFPSKSPTSRHCWVVSFSALRTDCFTTTYHKNRIKKPKLDYDYWYIKDVKRAASKPSRCIQVEGGKYCIGEYSIPTCNSTIITFAKTVQDILVNPEVTVGIFSHTRPIAKGFLDQIKRELESNEFLQSLFPNVLYKDPKRDAPHWSLDGGIVVKRKTNPKEATVEAHGLVDGQPISKHFSLLVYDDVVTLASVASPDMIKKTTDAWALSLNLGAHGGRKRIIGTRYHFNDTYKTIIERNAAAPRIHPATEDGALYGKPVFHTRAVLDKKREEQGSYVFSCQLLQNPIADTSQGFKKEWLMFYDVLRNHQGWTIYILVDPASEKKKTSDYTVVLVIGLAPDGNYYLIDAVRDRLNLTERTNKVFEFHRKYKPAAVGYEKYGIQSDIEHMRYVMEEQNYRFRIVPLGGPMAKNDRIKMLVPIFEKNRFFLPHKLNFIDNERKVRDFIREFIEDEYLAFPVAVHDDILDDMARILDPELGAKFPIRKENLHFATMRQDPQKAETEYALFD